MATWPGGSCWSFCCCAAVLGVITLKPDATSMLSLFCVVLVVAQPAVNATKAMTLIMLNDVRILFMILLVSGLVEFQPKELQPIKCAVVLDFHVGLWSYTSWAMARARSSYHCVTFAGSTTHDDDDRLRGKVSLQY